METETKSTHIEPNKPKLIRIEEVLKRTALAKSTLYAWESSNKFPRGIRLSKTMKVWLESDIDNWILEHHRVACEWGGDCE